MEFGVTPHVNLPGQYSTRPDAMFQKFRERNSLDSTPHENPLNVSEQADSI